MMFDDLVKFEKRLEHVKQQNQELGVKWPKCP